MHLTIEIGPPIFFFFIFLKNLFLCLAALVKDKSFVLAILPDFQDFGYHLRSSCFFHDKDSRKHPD